MPDKNNAMEIMSRPIAAEERLSSATGRKTALYCRTAAMCDFAIRGQEERLRLYVKENNYDNISSYIDNGESGASLNRPAMNRLIADIQSGEVETVIAISEDRFARGIAPLAQWVRILEKTNVECVTLNYERRDFLGEFARWRDFMETYEPVSNELESEAAFPA